MIFGLVVLWIASMVLAGRLLSPSGRGGLGVTLAFFFGPFGTLVAAIISGSSSRTAAESQTTRPCPMCAEAIRPEAIKCRHCGSVVPAAPMPPAHVEELPPPRFGALKAFLIVAGVLGAFFGLMFFAGSR